VHHWHCSLVSNSISMYMSSIYEHSLQYKSGAEFISWKYKPFCLAISSDHLQTGREYPETWLRNWMWATCEKLERQVCICNSFIFDFSFLLNNTATTSPHSFFAAHSLLYSWDNSSYLQQRRSSKEELFHISENFSFLFPSIINSQLLLLSSTNINDQPHQCQ